MAKAKPLSQTALGSRLAEVLVVVAAFAVVFLLVCLGFEQVLAVHKLHTQAGLELGLFFSYQPFSFTKDIRHWLIELTVKYWSINL